MNILCRLGLHSWKPVARKFYFRRLSNIGPVRALLSGGYDNGWRQIGCKCHRCGKRVVLP